MTTVADSDWACYKETRKSSSAAVILLGYHALKAYTRKQKIIARSSAEAELYAAALGASESKGIASLLKDLGYEMKPVSAIDAEATKHILHRQGIGKLTYLWMQDEIRSKTLRVRSVKSEEHVADLGTKPLSKAVIAKYCLTLGCVNMAEGNVKSKCNDVAMFRDFGSAVSLQQQTAGDHVQAAASSNSCSSNGGSGSTKCSQTPTRRRSTTKSSRRRRAT